MGRIVDGWKTAKGYARGGKVGSGDLMPTTPRNPRVNAMLHAKGGPGGGVGGGMPSVTPAVPAASGRMDVLGVRGMKRGGKVHREPDADDRGGKSDHDADNMGMKRGGSVRRKRAHADGGPIAGAPADVMMETGVSDDNYRKGGKVGAKDCKGYGEGGTILQQLGRWSRQNIADPGIGSGSGSAPSGGDRASPPAGNATAVANAARRIAAGNGSDADYKMVRGTGYAGGGEVGRAIDKGVAKAKGGENERHGMPSSSRHRRMTRSRA